MANTKKLQCEIKSNSCEVTRERRSANYKPNIWSYDLIQSLPTKYNSKIHIERVEKLKTEFMYYFSGVPELSKPLFVETIRKLGLSHLFYNEINDTLVAMQFKLNMNCGFDEDILRTTPLSFRLLRQHGYNVSQHILLDFFGENCFHKITKGPKVDVKGVLELFEASHLAADGEEDILENVKTFSYQYLVDNIVNMEPNLAKQVAYALEIPCHWKVLWFDVREQIHAYQLEHDNNLILLELAKLNFNIVQSIHLEDLKETSRWWKNLGLIERIGFARDRLAECFLWTVGVACEPQYSLLRKCLTKVVAFILVLDDAYDIYGSLDELERLTKFVQRWDNEEETEQLPVCLKICFQALMTTCDEIATEIHEEKGLSYDVISHFMKTAWADFCKALLMEAYWYQQHHIPSLEDYLKSAWISSSGPLLCLVAFLCTIDDGISSDELKNKWQEAQDLIYYTSLIIRLLNDQGTSAAEFERGDAHSSILCYMEEAKVTEEIAMEHINEIIQSAWSKVNAELLSATIEQQTFVNLVINTARVCHFIYKRGDGFSVQDGNTKKKIKKLLIEPLKL